MKKITLTLCAVALLMLGSSAANAMMGSFRIADINNDGNPEIVLNQAGSMYVLDKDGGFITSRTLNDIYAQAFPNDNNSTKITPKSNISGGMMGGGYGGGNGWGGMMGGGYGGGNGYGGMMGSGVMGGPDIEIADMDGDGIPEIVLRASSELIVLANNLDVKSTITLPGKQY